MFKTSYWVSSIGTLRKVLTLALIISKVPKFPDRIIFTAKESHNFLIHESRLRLRKFRGLGRPRSLVRRSREGCGFDSTEGPSGGDCPRCAAYLFRFQIFSLAAIVKILKVFFGWLLILTCSYFICIVLNAKNI